MSKMNESILSEQILEDMKENRIDHMKYLDDMEVRRETINPKNTTFWKPSFSGEGIGRVKIYIDDEIYMEYIVDFDEGIHEIDSDYSQDFQ